MRLVLMADTHVPRRARDLPAELWAAVDAADVVVHAGDWVDVALLDRLTARAARLIGVYGNNDGPELRARLPEVARAELAGLRLAVVHETGPATGRERRAAAAFPDVDVLVFGHSHIPWDSVAPSGPTPSGPTPSGPTPSGPTPGGPGTLRLLNPGSPTDRRRQPHCTYLTADVADGVLTAVRRHAVAPSS